MKAQDPTIQVGIDMAFGNATYSAASCPTGTVANYCAWDPIVLANAKYDFVEMHYYPNYGNIDNDSVLLTTSSNQIAANFATADALLALNGRANTPIYLGEFDRDSGQGLPCCNIGHESVDVVNALFHAIVVAEAVKAGAFGVTAFDDNCEPDSVSSPVSTAYGWQTFGSFGFFADSAAIGTYGCPDLGVPIKTPFPKARAYQILSQYVVAGEHVIAVASTDLSIRAYAATNKGGYALLLINTDETETHTLPVTVSNAAGSSYTATMLLYGKSQYDESQNGTWAGPVSGTIGQVGTTFSVSLPAWSITLVLLH